jgi:uncharacterized protein with HEPN domain
MMASQNSQLSAAAVAWRQIRALRNLAVHKYVGVDWAVVWKIAQDEVPLLEERCR